MVVGTNHISPNKNLQIYMNPLPTHDTNTIVQPFSVDIVYDSKMDDLNHIVNHVEHVVLSKLVSPPQPQSQPPVQVPLPQPQLQVLSQPKPKSKPQPKPQKQPKNKRPRELSITFDDSETIKDPDGPL